MAKKKKKNNQYLKIVEWSDEDGCYVGRAPGLILGGIQTPNNRPQIGLHRLFFGRFLHFHCASC
ncbi:MAG TPA: hypothetical protein DDW49_02830 [Deltaproteobacteria bacterium]|nr:MAG: hypothetical protein A2048_02460 [Deltaproteobacteria bacterium GWA2_45_12]HBF12314.1 hypothetical protein [Deltaproteobacteria bacterium]